MMASKFISSHVVQADSTINYPTNTNIKVSLIPTRASVLTGAALLEMAILHHPKIIKIRCAIVIARKKLMFYFVEQSHNDIGSFTAKVKIMRSRKSDQNSLNFSDIYIYSEWIFLIYLTPVLCPREDTRRNNRAKSKKSSEWS